MNHPSTPSIARTCTHQHMSVLADCELSSLAGSCWREGHAGFGSFVSSASAKLEKIDDTSGTLWPNDMHVLRCKQATASMTLRGCNVWRGCEEKLLNVPLVASLRCPNGSDTQIRMTSSVQLAPMISMFVVVNLRESKWAKAG